MRRLAAWVTAALLIVGAWSVLWYASIAEPSERDAAAFAAEIRTTDPGVADLWVEAERIESAAIWVSGVLLTVALVAVAAFAVERRRTVPDAAA